MPSIGAVILSCFMNLLWLRHFSCAYRRARLSEKVSLCRHYATATSSSSDDIDESSNGSDDGGSHDSDVGEAKMQPSMKEILMPHCCLFLVTDPNDHGAEKDQGDGGKNDMLSRLRQQWSSADASSGATVNSI